MYGRSEGQASRPSSRLGRPIEVSALHGTELRVPAAAASTVRCLMPPVRPPTTSPLGQLQFQAQLLAAIQDSVIFTDLEGQITYWNHGAEELFGYAAAEIVGQTPAVLYPTADSVSLDTDLERIMAGQSY